jgi:hypothetical protein
VTSLEPLWGRPTDDELWSVIDWLRDSAGLLEGPLDSPRADVIERVAAWMKLTVFVTQIEPEKGVRRLRGTV